MVVEALSRRIASGDYPQGSRLPSERALAASLNVARNTLREALEQLEKSGLILRRAGAGSYVTQPEHWDNAAPVMAATGPLHLHVVRGILEPEITRLAILNMPPVTLDLLARIHERMQTETDAAGFARLEEDFLEALAQGTGNPLLSACYNLVITTRRQRHRSAMLRRHMTPERIDQQRQGYGALLSALAARDIAEAVDLVQQLLLEEQRLFMQED
ncbi:GntR family transcriptional regulator [Paracoccus limosus]|uniref:GntR family transcriptional regulator n=1 Tax=Paracoccus limosus TaxID=913252 RepID=A0A844HAW6_9RHOB|nr:GntR family transcriptional regulator [Paracoccus limosus]MTH36167.1 GntR family transcriptional regulator [Paracoccus limosus]